MYGNICGQCKPHSEQDQIGDQVLLHTGRKGAARLFPEGRSLELAGDGKPRKMID